MSCFSRFRVAAGDPSSGPVVGRRPFLAGIAAFAAGGFALPSLRGEAAPSPRDVLTFFDTVGLMTRGRNGSAAPGRVRKWTGPVAVHIHGMPSRRDIAKVRHLLATLSHWTGLPFAIGSAAPGDTNRVDLHFRSRAEIDARHGAESRIVCHCETYGDSGALLGGTIDVGIGFTDCLAHEFMHALGFDNHWTGRMATPQMPSVLALRFAAARTSRFTRYDELAIRTLYDPRLEPGMSRAAALRPAGRVIAGLVDA